MWTWRQDGLGRERLCEPNSDVISHRKSQRFIWKASRWRYCFVTSEPYFVEAGMQPRNQEIWIEQTYLSTHTKKNLPRITHFSLIHRVTCEHEFKSGWAGSNQSIGCFCVSEKQVPPLPWAWINCRKPSFLWLVWTSASPSPLGWVPLCSVLTAQPYSAALHLGTVLTQPFFKNQPALLGANNCKELSGEIKVKWLLTCSFKAPTWKSHPRWWEGCWRVKIWKLFLIQIPTLKTGTMEQNHACSISPFLWPMTADPCSHNICPSSGIFWSQTHFTQTAALLPPLVPVIVF